MAVPNSLFISPFSEGSFFLPKPYIGVRETVWLIKSPKTTKAPTCYLRLTVPVLGLEGSFD